ncbi:uncharacterized protein GGS22DRAFT_158836 [Annulohypoxylon maeteangense]|uniref:uncharacterized protein n=1 Tax=Annulohypoxylon maeteangense TaxID=1927788 RepID=UPI002008A084|nr:uncharacterized protein GGS22DRAFT_158836 [Annulohypoxylon maeteangense]KAI0886842.1 hypothetical protein GGS22DRAFT_158836 [Annulohypoxylon maeteangense]
MVASTATRTSENVLAALAKKVYGAVGFSKGYNFWLWFILGGCFSGFSFSRLKYLDFYNSFCGSSNPGGRDLAVPGECFYYLTQRYYGVGIVAHLATILPASLLACIQFIPVVRRKAMGLHRIIGWITVALSVPGSITALMIAPRSQGGGLDTQSMVAVLGVMFLFSLTRGCISVKRHKIAEHRAWMLRAWVYGGSIVTMRVIMVVAVVVISMIGGFYYVEPCDKINFMLKGENATLAVYPDCAPFLSGEDPDRHIAVLASVFHRENPVQVAAALNLVFGTSGWMAIFLNTLGVELYLRSEPAQHSAKKSN